MVNDVVDSELGFPGTGASVDVRPSLGVEHVATPCVWAAELADRQRFAVGCGGDRVLRLDVKSFRFGARDVHVSVGLRAHGDLSNPARGALDARRVGRFH